LGVTQRRARARARIRVMARARATARGRVTRVSITRRRMPTFTLLPLLLISSRKSHTVFRLIPTSVTLNNLEPSSSTYFALFHRMR